MPQDLLPNMPHYPGLVDDGVADIANIPPQLTSAYNDRTSVAPPAQQDYMQAAEILTKYPSFTSSMLSQGYESFGASDAKSFGIGADAAPVDNNQFSAPDAGKFGIDTQAATPMEASQKDTAELDAAASLKNNAALANTGGSAYSDVRPSLNKEKMEVETRADPLVIDTPKLAPVAGMKNLPTEDIPVLAGGELGTGFVGTDQYGTSGDPSSGRVGQGFATVEGI